MCENICTDLRIVLVGKTGSGKSASGNRILGNHSVKPFISEFKPTSVTTECRKAEATDNGVTISVIDTPGVFDTEMGEETLNEEVGHCIELSLPGPHAFILVIRLDVRFTEEEKGVIEWIKNNFGEGALKYTIVLFTHGDHIKPTSVDEYIKESKEMLSLVTSCGNRYHSFDNEHGEKDEVLKLLANIKEMVAKNGGMHYTSEAYEIAQRRQKWNKIVDGALVAMTAVGTGTAVVGGTVLGVHSK